MLIWRCAYVCYPTVLSNVPGRYTVPNPRGNVKEHCCVDMLVMTPSLITYHLCCQSLHV